MILEEKTDFPAEYKLSDIFLPLKHLRHLPEIIKREDPIIKAHGIGTSIAITLAQAAMYYPVYHSLFS